MTKKLSTIAALVVGVVLLQSCGTPEIPPAMRPLSKDAMMLLGKKGLKTEAPIFVRIFKEESELEVWKARDDGRYYHFKTYPICTWSGALGPKLKQGDKQAPEGFYNVSKGLMNPNSSFHLAFNLGYPNAYDRAHGRTGNALMVHGKCTSAGCYAMTDALIEEIYALAREQFAAGHSSFPVHAFPFRMTDENLARHKSSEWYGFWRTLKDGYDHFELTRQVPPVAICGRRYHVNARPIMNASLRLDPQAQCPRLERLAVEPFVPASKEKQLAETRVVVPGVKRRAIAAAAPQETPPATGIGGLIERLTTTGGMKPAMGLTGGSAN